LGISLKFDHGSLFYHKNEDNLTIIQDQAI